MIPIRNIYYLLAYTWDQVEESRIVSVGSEEFNRTLDLLARVLQLGASRLLKQGLYREYRNRTEEIVGIRGKLCLTQSISRGSFRNAKAVCQFGELSRNVLHNQILKMTITNLVKVKDLDATIRNELYAILHRLHEVSSIRLTRNHFREVRLHRNNRFYRFLLSVCELIFLQTIPDPSGADRSQFVDFPGDKKSLHRLFEKFVRNFYKKEQTRYRVKITKMKWQNARSKKGGLDKLPEMVTDITLRNKKTAIVFDTKFYQKTLLKTQYGKEKIRSTHLYQLVCYLNNYRQMPNSPEDVRGVLLYPTVDQEIDYSYTISGFPIRIATVNLAENWRMIHNRLLSLLKLEHE